MAWQNTEDGYRCEVHDVTFSHGDVCKGCLHEARRPIEVTTHANEHDAVLEALEAELETERKEWKRRAADLWKGTPSERNTAIKAGELALKTAQKIVDLRDRRAKREHERAAIQHHREMMGLRRHSH